VIVLRAWEIKGGILYRVVVAAFGRNSPSYSYLRSGRQVDNKINSPEENNEVEPKKISVQKAPTPKEREK